MDLFNTSSETNLLPMDGVVHYHGRVIDADRAPYYLQSLLDTIDWRNDEAIMFGRYIVTKRKAAWYGDAGYAYTYSNITKRALPWTKDLLELKEIVERVSGATYNSCLLNLYHDGTEGMAWHSDDEKMLAKDGAIASLSFGAGRKFSFKHKTNAKTIDVLLEAGSLLVMRGTTQTHWLHRLPPTRKVLRPRINLTFRTIVLT